MVFVEGDPQSSHDAKKFGEAIEEEATLSYNDIQEIIEGSRGPGERADNADHQEA